MTEKTPLSNPAAKSMAETWLVRLGKGWIIATSAFGTLVVLLVVIIAAAFSQPQEQEEIPLQQKIIEKGGPDQVAVVDVSGVIMDSAESGDPFSYDSGIASSRDLVQMLDTLEDQEEVKAVVLRINSPGGAVVASDELYQAVVQLSAKKPVIAQMGDMAASGGYYVAVGADKIIANKATLTGSIGVIAQFPEFTALMEKVGVNMRTFKSGEFKDIGAYDRPLTEEETAILQSVIDDSYDQFVDAVIAERGLPEDEVRRLADGRVYTGLQAVENGLVDELGGFDRAVEMAAEAADITDPTIVEYTDESLFAALFSSVAGTSPTAQLDKLLPSSKFGVYYMLSL